MPERTPTAPAPTASHQYVKLQQRATSTACDCCCTLGLRLIRWQSTMPMNLLSPPTLSGFLSLRQPPAEAPPASNCSLVPEPAVLHSTSMAPTPSCTLPRRRQSMPYSPSDRKSTRLNSSHLGISYAVFC